MGGKAPHLCRIVKSVRKERKIRLFEEIVVTVPLADTKMNQEQQHVYYVHRERLICAQDPSLYQIVKSVQEEPVSLDCEPLAQGARLEGIRMNQGLELARYVHLGLSEQGRGRSRLQIVKSVRKEPEEKLSRERLVAIALLVLIKMKWDQPFVIGARLERLIQLKGRNQ